MKRLWIFALIILPIILFTDIISGTKDTSNDKQPQVEDTSDPSDETSSAQPEPTSAESNKPAGETRKTYYSRSTSNTVSTTSDTITPQVILPLNIQVKLAMASPWRSFRLK